MPNYYLEQLGSEQPEESYNQEINNSSGYIQQPNQQQPQKGWKLESLGNDQPQEESFLGNVGRKAAIMSKGVTQRVLGAPADIAEVPRSILKKLFSYAPEWGKEGLIKDMEESDPENAQQWRDLMGEVPQMRGPAAHLTSKAFGKGFTDSAEFLFGTKPSSFKPKTKFEKFLYSGAKDAASVGLGMILGAPKGLAFGAIETLAPNLVKSGLNELNVGKEKQQWAKLGTQLAIGAYGLFKPKAVATGIYDEIDKSVSKQRMADLPRTQAELEKIEDILNTGNIVPKWKAVLREHVGTLETVAEEGKGKFRAALADKRALGKVISDFKTPKDAKPFLINLQNALKNDLYASVKGEKGVLGKLKYADEIYRDVSKHMETFNKLRGIASTGRGKAALGLGSLGALTMMMVGLNYMPKSTLALGVIGGLAGLVNIATDSLTIKKYYAKVMALAAHNKKQQLGVALRNLDKAVTKEFGSLNKKQSGNDNLTPPIRLR